jgi:hypothetical protein
MAGFDDIKKKAQDFLASEKAEEVSDKILGGAAGLANKVTGDKHADKIEKARSAIDGKIGPQDGKPGTPA